MTGLGGGVVVISWLTGITRLRYDQALACSLLTIGTTASLSAWYQGKMDLSLENWMGLGVGVLLAALLVKKCVSFLQPFSMTLVRKLAFSGVILFSMGRTLAELF
jgi:uncharacterized membrane protein YfcA